jgi:hypothetical protein
VDAASAVVPLPAEGVELLSVDSLGASGKPEDGTAPCPLSTDEAAEFVGFFDRFFGFAEDVPVEAASAPVEVDGDSAGPEPTPDFVPLESPDDEPALELELVDD